MVILNSKTVVSDSLETLLGLKKYCEIIKEVESGEYENDSDFRKKFNGYFKVRQRPKDWYDKYYELLGKQREEESSFEDLLGTLFPYNNSVEVSFVSKLMASIDPSYPIWDSFVLKNLGLDKQWNKYNFKDKDIRIEKAAEIYEQIKTKYSDFLNSEEGKKCIKIFDELFPNYKGKINDVKKIDFWLWSKRKEEEKK